MREPVGVSAVARAVEELEGSAVRTRLGSALCLALLVLGCGYEPVYAGERPAQRLSVVAAPGRLPDVSAGQAALAGARAELSAAGVLASGQGHPRLVVQLTRVDERSLGVLAGSTGNDETPLARGSALAVVGRAWVEEEPGAPPTRDTGDMRRSARVAAHPDPLGEGRRNEEAVSAAARRLGRALARRVLGYPEPADEAP